MKENRSWFARQYKGVLLLLAIFTAGMLAVTVYLLRQVTISERKVFSLSFFALLLGLVFEYRRLVKNWPAVLYTLLGAYLLSFIAFARGKNAGPYIFQERLQLWPWYFLGAFVLIAVVVLSNTLARKLTEGITLLLVFAMNYWLLSQPYWEEGGFFIKVLIVLHTGFTFFALYHAFSYTRLTKGSRLLLSLGSSAITLTLAADNLLHIYRQGSIETLSAFPAQAMLFGEYFLLGVAGMYIAQNLTMLLGYLPGKHYGETLADMNEAHLQRFSGEQVHIGDSLIVSVFSFAGFMLNYFFGWLPVNFAIWLMIGIAPLLLKGVYRLFG